MKKIQYICLLIALVLVGCDENGESFFYHRIPFEGTYSPKQLVVNARLYAGMTPRVYVNESQYLYDSVAINSSRFPTAYVGDATVKMVVNGDTMLLERKLGEVIYQNSYVLQPGDEVLISVSHRKYELPATVRQTIPYPLNPTFTIGDTTKFDTHKIRMDVPAYKGNKEDYFRIACRMRLEGESYWEYDQGAFSKDERFAYCLGTNVPLSLSYYGSNYFLYAPVPQEATSYEIEVGYPSYHKTLAPGRVMIFDSLQVWVDVVSKDEYLFDAKSIETKYAEVSLHVHDYYDLANIEDTEAGDILELIEDMFNEMGNMETPQMYHNIENGIGHVTSVTEQMFMLER